MAGQQPTHGFIGAGAAGTALATAISKAGHLVTAIHSADPADASRLAASVNAQSCGTAQDVVTLSDTVWLTVPDDVIQPACEALPWQPEHRVIHCSGAGSLDLLAAASKQGAATAVFHPLQSFAVPDRASTNLPGSYVGIEASNDALAAELSALARAIGCQPGALPADRSAYHVSAVLGSNALVALLDLAAELWPGEGGKEEGLAALLPLVRGTIANLEAIGLPDALTGPIARGDVGTIERHIALLREAPAALRRSYAELGLATLPVAHAKGSLSEEAAARIATLLEELKVMER